MHSKPRVGSIEFINSLPVDLGILTRSIPLDAEIIQGTPVFLNERILAGDLDISPVSALWYAEHQKDLLLLPDLSISSESGVQSVLLFSRIKFRDLEGARVVVTGKGRTTTALLEILFRSRFGFMAEFDQRDEKMEAIPQDADAMLLIGDEALIVREKLKNEKIEIIDLAEEWRVWAKHPFVFAVWAVRKSYFDEEPEVVLSIKDKLLQSREWGMSHTERVLDRAIAQTGLSKDSLTAYFDHLSYHFNESMQAGMWLFFEYALRCGIIKALGPLEFVGNLNAPQTEICGTCV